MSDFTIPHTDEQERAFILELTALTRKHGIAIAGCGCCGSPRLEAADVSDERSGYADRDRLAWIAPSDKLLWEREKDHIIGVEQAPESVSIHGCHDFVVLAAPLQDDPTRCICSVCKEKLPQMRG